MSPWSKAAILAAAIVAATLPASPAVAAEPGGSTAYCEFSGDFTTDPVSATTQANANWQNVGEMAVSCTGKVKGATVTGEGTYREWGSTYGDCTQGTGSGQYEAYIPTTAGVKKVTGTFSMWYAVDATGGHGEETGSSIDATFQFAPTVGTCTPGDPMTGFHLTQQQYLYT